MNWKIKILSKAENDLAWFRKNNKALYIKCFDLIREMMINPRYGTGKPEKLKFFDREVWSRRVSDEHRLVYVIYSEEEQVEIVSCRSHLRWHYAELNLIKMPTSKITRSAIRFFN